MAPNASAPKGGSIDDILRALKPKGVEIPEARPPIVDPLPDHKPGGIDAVLAKLKPMPPKPASPTAGPNEHIAATEPSARAGEPTITPGLVVPVFPTGERDIKNTVQHDDENTVVLGRTGSTTAATRRHMAQLDITAARQHILQTQSVEDMTPRAKLELRKANVRTNLQAEKREKRLVQESERLRKKIAEAEAKKAAKSGDNRA